MALAQLEPQQHDYEQMTANGRLFLNSDFTERPHLVSDPFELDTLSDAYMQATADLLGQAKGLETEASRLDPYYLKHPSDVWNGLGQIAVTSSGEYIEAEDLDPGTHVATLSFNPLRSAWLVATTRQLGTREEAILSDAKGDLQGTLVTYDAAGRATTTTELEPDDVAAYETFLKDALRPEVIGRQIQATRTARDMVKQKIEEHFIKAGMTPSASWLELSEDEIKQAASAAAFAERQAREARGEVIDEDAKKELAAIYRSGKGLSELRKKVTHFPLTHMTPHNTPTVA